jgi:hypothetical protein
MRNHYHLVLETPTPTWWRGWLGGKAAIPLGSIIGTSSLRQMLAAMAGQLGEHHAGELRRESAEVKAERIVAEELKRLGWNAGDLASRRKSDPGKLGLAARLRQETTLTLKAIARRVQLGTSRSAHVRWHEWIKSSAATAESRSTK